MIAHVYAQHNLWFVLLAAVVCAAASVTTFTIYSHLLARGGAYRIAWLLLAGFCAGAGIWSTHFVAMLAHDSGLATGYDPLLTAASFGLAVAMTTLGIAISMPRPRAMTALGGAVIGLGIAAMHFVGMYALIVAATLEWNMPLAGLAVLLGVVFTASAMLAYRAQKGLRALLSAAALFTVAICATHFTGMAALTIVAAPALPAPVTHIEGSILAIAVAGVTAIILLAGYVVAQIDGRAMRDSFARTGELVEAAMEGLVIADYGTIVNINARALELSGRSSMELIGKTVFGDLLGPQSRRMGASGAKYFFAAPLLRKDGSTIPVEVVRRPLRGLNHANEVYAIRDLRERQEAARLLTHANQELSRREQDLRVRNLILADALGNMSQGLCMYDAGQQVVISNEQFATIYGLPRDSIKPGMSLRDVVQMRIDNGIFAGASPAAYMEDRLAPLQKAQNSVHKLNNGQIIGVTRRPMPGGGWVTTHSDITERRHMEEQVAHLAHHDHLTGLLSRTSLRDRLAESLDVAGKRDRRLAVLILGINRFSEINDTLGHAAGDMLLKDIAARLRDATRRATLLGRFGDDSFVLVEVVEQPGRDATGLANRIQAEIRKPFTVGENSLEMTCTIGIAVSPADGTDADTLLKNAAIALNRGKTHAPGLHNFFEPAMDKELRNRRALERDLSQALEKQQLEIHYQPLVNLARNDITGFEALLRWQHPMRGWMPTESFLPLAEETGLINPIGEWMLRQACTQAVEWPKPFTVAVGVCPAQFRSNDFVRSVIRILASTGLTADRLEIEISEKAMHDNAEQAIKTLRQLSDLGVLIALNDFGSGFASLAYLRQFPVHKIKIDRGFLTDLSARQDSQVIIRTLARLGSGLGIVTTVEGIETKEQLDIVRAGGCTEMQGMYFSPPKTAEEIRGLFLAKPKETAEAVA